MGWMTGRKQIFLVVGKEPGSAFPPVGFANSIISAETYITARNLEDLLKPQPIWLYDEVDDAFNHQREIERAEIIKRLAPHERELLGVKL